MATDVWEAYPTAQIDLDSRAYYEGLLRRELRLARCAGCGRLHNPPRPICPFCWSFEIEPTAVAGTGVIDLAMVLQQGPEEQDVSYPYPVVAVGLDEEAGLRLTGTLLDPLAPVEAIGRRVETEWISRGGAPWPAFRLTENGGNR